MDNKEQVLFYTVSDLYELLPIGRNSIYRLVNRSDFPKLRVGKRIIIPVQKLTEWLEINIGAEITLSEVE